jgi:hypothetical protein
LDPDNGVPPWIRIRIRDPDPEGNNDPEKLKTVILIISSFEVLDVLF